MLNLPRFIRKFIRRNSKPKQRYEALQTRFVYVNIRCLKTRLIQILYDLYFLIESVRFFISY